VLRLARALGAPLDRDTASPLYVALLTDTGRFCYSNTDPRSFRAAAELLEAGVDPSEVSREIYRSKPHALLRLEAEVVSRLRFERNGTLGWSHIRRSDYARFGLDEHEAQDLVDIPKGVRGVAIAVLFREVEGGGEPGGPGEPKVKVSLRSEGQMDVSDFAAGRGGGGHPRAAGFTTTGALEDVERRVIGELLLAAGPA
jgi:phosphoesterase RecJ-like protein